MVFQGAFMFYWCVLLLEIYFSAVLTKGPVDTVSLYNYVQFRYYK